MNLNFIGWTWIYQLDKVIRSALNAHNFYLFISLGR